MPRLTKLPWESQENALRCLHARQGNPPSRGTLSACPSWRDRFLSCKRFVPYPASRGFFLASLLACTKLFALLVFREVGLFTSPRETSATSRLHFSLSMRFRYLQILGGRLRDKQVKNRFKRVCQLMRIYLFADLVCKNEPALSRKMAAIVSGEIYVIISIVT